MPVDEEFLLRLKPAVSFIRPMPSSVPRGANSKNVQQPTFSIRIKQEQLDTISEAAALLGMTRSAFLIWCGEHAALDIIKQHHEYTRRKK